MRSINIPNLSVLNRLLKITHNDHSLDYGFLIANVTNIYIIGVYEKVNKKTCNTSITLAITEVVRLCICHGCLAICVYDEEHHDEKPAVACDTNERAYNYLLCV